MWGVVLVVFAVSAAGAAEFTYVPEGRSGLEIPEAIWERVCAETGSSRASTTPPGPSGTPTASSKSPPPAA
jgi:hypothetical protein